MLTPQEQTEIMKAVERYVNARERLWRGRRAQLGESRGKDLLLCRRRLSELRDLLKDVG